MKKLLTYLLSTVLLIVTCCPINAQTNPCANLYDLDSPSIGSFPNGATVYLDVTALSSSHDPEYQALSQQSIAAAQQWANALGSYITLNTTGSAPAGARTITVKPGVNPDNPDNVAYVPKLSGPDRVTFDSWGNIQTVSILINLDARIYFSHGSVQAVNPLTSSTIGGKMMRHEYGHIFGGLHESRDDVGGSGCFGEIPGATVMNSICGPNDALNNMPLDIPDCDKAAAINQIVNSSPPAGGGSGAIQPCLDSDGSHSGCGFTPVLIDLLGDGFSMTDADNGVWFTFFPFSIPLRLSWTSENTDDAWLTLDRNQDGVINDATELFSNVAWQPSSSTPNGFIALSEFDKNEDGEINSSDWVFDKLLLWQDRNHNGISEWYEQTSLKFWRIQSIELKIRESKRVDEFGNQFRYRVKIVDSSDLKISRWAWDVFLTTEKN